jgi:antitoxin component of MazEF toxin-antitoxin module
MLRMLKKYGNSYALIIDRVLMEQLGITSETPLQLVVSDGALHVTPIRHGLGSERVHALADALFDRYDESFHELAK